MVVTAAQTTAFFEHDDQMGIPHATVVQMAREGIATVADLADFEEKSIKQLAENLRRPGGRVPDPNPAAGPGATIPTPAFEFGAKSQKRLVVASELVRYYETTSRDPTAANIRWTHVMRNFHVQWEALKDEKDGDTPEVPKISKALPVIKWTGAFQDFLTRAIGVRTIPLCYVVRPTVAVPVAAPALAANQPHSEEHGSVQGELIARSSHAHALFKNDNATVYHYLEEATRSTPYAASIKPYQRNHDGRGAWLALLGQYAGKDKWEAEIKRQEQLIHTRQWKGQSNFTLESFISQHRNAFVSMEACAEHVDYQLPNQHSRVGFLLEAIQCSDAGLQAAMASIKTDNGPGGMRTDFEAAAAHLLPYDPVAKKRLAGAKRGGGLISAVGGDDATIAATSGKPSIGKTGVHLRYHTSEEYRNLAPAQKMELKQWRTDNPPPPTKKPKGLTKKQVSSLLRRELNRGEEEKKQEGVDKAYIMSMIKECLATPPPPPPNQPLTATASAAAASSTLKSILKRAKNGQA